MCPKQTLVFHFTFVELKLWCSFVIIRSCGGINRCPSRNYDVISSSVSSFFINTQFSIDFICVGFKYFKQIIVKNVFVSSIQN
ncbi:hypothetical protein BpHYR1_048142 [Brachionus plicatilis]|uniref:Uncharacterized protein n=1 Tax=Brachionus plicatilis TaxID=10195 RepID=A0A3M7T0G9_BRAPC|nr:hypothetical protein BpHYR1_048142 [Brachionus plicatilis]